MRRAIHMQIGHATGDGGDGNPGGLRSRDCVSIRLGQMRRIYKADEGVEAGRTEFLPVGGLAGVHEAVVVRRTFQRRYLDPLLTGAFAPRCRMRLHVDAAGDNVLDQRHAGVRRDVGIRRVQYRHTGVDDSDWLCLPIWRGRAQIGVVLAVRPRPPLIRQGVGERLIEQIVGDLAGLVARAATRVVDDDLEATQRGLAVIHIAADRIVVLEHKEGHLARRQRVLRDQHGQRRTRDVCRRHIGGGDLRGPHGMTGRLGGSREEWRAGVTWQNRDEVALGRIERDIGRVRTWRERAGSQRRPTHRLCIITALRDGTA